MIYITRIILLIRNLILPLNKLVILPIETNNYNISWLKLKTLLTKRVTKHNYWRESYKMPKILFINLTDNLNHSMIKYHSYKERRQEDNLTYNHSHLTYNHSLLTYKVTETKQHNCKFTYKEYILNNNRLKVIKSHNNCSKYKDLEHN